MSKQMIHHDKPSKINVILPYLHTKVSKEQWRVYIHVAAKKKEKRTND